MVYEIYGSPDSGKTIFAINKAKQHDHLCLYINADYQIMTNMMHPQMYILNENNITTIKDAINKLISHLDSVIIDSLPMITNSEENTNKVISEIQKIISLCNRNKIDLYIINQYKMNNKEDDYTYYLNRLRLYYNKRIKVG